MRRGERSNDVLGGVGACVRVCVHTHNVQGNTRTSGAASTYNEACTSGAVTALDDTLASVTASARNEWVCE